MSTESPDVFPSVGPVAGKYDLVKLIGRGGMGTVWEGRHTTLGNRVAIKFIDAEYADSPEARTRFDNEARAAATIQSKHAIQIFDHGVTDDGKPYIVMELLVGEPLDQRIERFGRLPLQETARILRQVARALARAHERGIVHRDLKPENIFLVRTPDDDEEVAKVLDFGIAKFKRMDGQSGSLSGGNMTSSTKTGAVLGTPFYMAPEQARGLRDLDYRVDLWSMGVIAYKCVCGALPFEGVSVGDLLVKICTTPAPIPSATVPALGPSFDAWFAHALEKEPAKRFQSALELAEALAYSAGLSIKRATSLSPTSDPLAVPATSNPPVRNATSRSSPNATSAPLTASNPRANPSSRGVIIAAMGATVVGGVLALGGFAVIRSRGHANEGATGLAASMVNVPHAAASAPVAVAAADLAATADAGGAAAIEVADHEKGASPHHHGGTHPGGTKPVTGGTATIPTSGTMVTTTPAQPAMAPPPLPSVAPPAVVLAKPPPTATPKPASSVIDPGY